MSKEKINIKGEVTIAVKSKDGTTREFHNNNIVTTKGKEFFMRKIFQRNVNDSPLGTGEEITHIAIGKSTQTQTIGDVLGGSGVMTDRIQKAINYDVSSILSDAKNSAIFLTNFLDTDADTLLTSGNPVPLGEIGLIASDQANSPAGEVLVCRTTFPQTSPETTFTKQKTDVITVTWKITIN